MKKPESRTIQIDSQIEFLKEKFNDILNRRHVIGEKYAKKMRKKIDSDLDILFEKKYELQKLTQNK